MRELLSRGETIKAAQHLKLLLKASGGEYRQWLRQTFKIAPDHVVTDQLVGAIRQLYCPIIATTNYDKLITLLHYPVPVMDGITWRNPSRMHDARIEGGAVLHLHGVYDDPESVVFGEDDYETVVQRAPAYRDVLKTLWLDRTLLFIGCSFEGVALEALCTCLLRPEPPDTQRALAVLERAAADPSGAVRAMVINYFSLRNECLITPRVEC